MVETLSFRYTSYSVLADETETDCCAQNGSTQSCLSATFQCQVFQKWDKKNQVKNRYLFLIHFLWMMLFAAQFLRKRARNQLKKLLPNFYSIFTDRASDAFSSWIFKKETRNQVKEKTAIFHSISMDIGPVFLVCFPFETLTFYQRRATTRWSHRRTDLSKELQVEQRKWQISTHYVCALLRNLYNNKQNLKKNEAQNVWAESTYKEVS